MRLLIVDDKEENRALFETLLRSGGYETDTAVEGGEALRKLRGRDFGLVVSDVLMPGMDGFQLCREIKGDPNLSQIPVVLVTAAYTDSKDERFALGLGAARFLVKPVDPSLFLGVIREVLASEGAGGGAQSAEVTKEYLAGYSERLASQLEKKMQEAERANAELLIRLRELNCIHGISTLGTQPGISLEDVFRRAAELLSSAWGGGMEACARIVYDGAEYRSDNFRETPRLRRAPIMVDEREKGRVDVYSFADPDPRDVSAAAREKRLLASVAALLGKMAGRDLLDAQFRQAQKMEAVGRLAGGVAHDFNNLLTAIICNAEMCLMNPGAEGNAEKIETIMETAERAARLTRQLLAFSRSHVLDPVDLDMNRLVREMNKMLGRLLGEDIEFRSALAADPLMVKADPSQFEQVVLNLVVNARDAMPRGGEILLATERIVLDEGFCRPHGGLEPGAYGLLSVSDGGVGMAPEVTEHIFEPFFTTKEEGTGLGLSTVYGIVRQLKGHIEVLSEPGAGTTFRLYFPLLGKGKAEGGAKREPGGLYRGTETIFVVEDDENLRNLVVDVLRALGYTVLMSDSGQGTFHRLKSFGGKVDLLLTDVVLPDTRGPEIARRLAGVYEGLKVLYTSGYPDRGRGADGHGDEADFLPKPFSAMALARKVRSVLDGGEPRRETTG